MEAKTITMPGVAPKEVAAVPCEARNCEGFGPLGAALCDHHWTAWCDSRERELVREVEKSLYAAFLARTNATVTQPEPAQFAAAEVA